MEIREPTRKEMDKLLETLYSGLPRAEEYKEILEWLSTLQPNFKRLPWKRKDGV